MTRAIPAPGGRTLAVHDEGDPSGFPVVVHHGTPASGLQYAPHIDAAREQGIRLIGYDRPGYGDSDRDAGRTVADCVADVHAIADALELERFASWGISGGGPHVLACAALCDERLTAVASLASVAPYSADGLDFLEGMGEDNHVEFGKALAGDDDLRPYLETEAASMRDATPDELREVLDSLLGDEDRSVLTGRLAEYFVASTEHGLARGVDGWLDDDIAFTKAWGFAPEDIWRPVLIAQGEDDRFVPASHARWLAERIVHAEVRITADDGHLTLIERHMRSVNEWLLAHS